MKQFNTFAVPALLACTIGLSIDDEPSSGGGAPGGEGEAGEAAGEAQSGENDQNDTEESSDNDKHND